MKKKELEPKEKGSTKELSETGESNPSSSMVDIVVSMKQDDVFGNCQLQFSFDEVSDNVYSKFTANLKVSSFDLILSLEFLLKIAQFMTPPEEDTVTKIGSSPSPNVEKQVVTTTSASSSKAPKSKISIVVSPESLFPTSHQNISIFSYSHSRNH